MASSCLLATIGTHQTFSGTALGGGMQMKGMVAEFGLYSILGNATIALWGVLLFVLSPRVAAKIVV